MARPAGSMAAVHKTRRDYRFGQETMEHIADGMAIFAGTLKETGFVERAIAHYAEFLAGDPEALAPLTQEMERLQEHIRHPRNAQQTSEGVAQSVAFSAADQAQEIERLQVQLHTLEEELHNTQAALREAQNGRTQAQSTLVQPAN